MKKILSRFCLSLLLVLFAAGQFLAGDVWPQLVAFSVHYHPNALWTVGWIVEFAIMPAFTLALVIAALKNPARSKTLRKAMYGQGGISLVVVATMLAGVHGSGSLIWLFIVLPFAALQAGASLGFAMLHEHEFTEAQREAAPPNSD